MALGLFDKRAARIVKRKKGEGTIIYIYIYIYIYISFNYYICYVFLGEKISLRDVKDFSLSLWLIFIVCVMYYVTVFPFIGVAT